MSYPHPTLWLEPHVSMTDVDARCNVPTASRAPGSRNALIRGPGRASGYGSFFLFSHFCCREPGLCLLRLADMWWLRLLWTCARLDWTQSVCCCWLFRRDFRLLVIDRLCPKWVYYEIPITDWAFLRAILHAYNALRGSGNVFGRLELLA